MFTNHLLYCREGDGESMSVPHRTVYKTSCASELTSLAVLPPADCNTDGHHTTDRHTTGRHTNGRYTNRPVRLLTQSLLFKYILVILACLVKGKYILACLVKGKYILACLIKGKYILVCLVKGKYILVCLVKGKYILACLVKGKYILACLVNGKYILACLIKGKYNFFYQKLTFSDHFLIMQFSVYENYCREYFIKNIFSR